MEEGKTARHFDVVILGGGFAGVYCARRVLKRLGHLDKTVCIVSEENHMVFQPMLPEVVGGSLSPRHVVNPIRLLCRGAEVLRGTVRAVDCTARTVTVDGGSFSPNVRVGYDHIVFAMGATVDLSRIPGMAEHSFLMRNAGDAMKLRATIINRMEEANLIDDAALRRRVLSFVVVGGGHSGVETAGQMAGLLRGVCRYYARVNPDEPTVTLVHSRERLLPTLDESLSDYTKVQLEKGGIRVVLNQRVRAATAKTVLLDGGEKIEATTVVCTVGNAPHPLIVQLGTEGSLPLEKGKIPVNDKGQVRGCHNMWAGGDCSIFPKADGGVCPETAQFAMRQGLNIGDNIAASVFEHPLEAFTFTGLGELAVIGHRSAVASILGVNFAGFVAWFMWRTIYLAKLPGLDRKIRVMVEWTLDLFFPRDINLLTPDYSSPLTEMHLEPGDPLFRSGEPAFSLYCVKSGRVDITDAKGELVKSVGAGEHFGERALLDDHVWRFNATAREPSTLVALDGRTFGMLVGAVDSLDRMFTESSRQYAMPEQINHTVACLPPGLAGKTAADVMTRDVATLSDKASVDDALRLFQSKHHSVYPVVDAGGHVIGGLRRAALYDWLAHHDLDRAHAIADVPLSTLLRVRADTPVPELLENLIRAGVTKAAVVDEGQTLQGIVALYDLIERPGAA